MRVIAKAALRVFWEGRPDAEQPLKAWYAEARAATWKTPADVKGKYRSASVLRDSRIVFNIAGNKYRLVVKIRYAFQVIYIRFLGTHRQYDQIDAETV